MAAILSDSVSSSSSRPRTAAMAKDAVARALVCGFDRAREAVGGSQMLVRRRGWPGMWRERNFCARVWDVAGLKSIVALWVCG